MKTIVKTATAPQPYICSIFAVLLRSTDEEVGRLVGEVKKKFEEKYHSCEAFREECLTGEKA